MVEKMGKQRLQEQGGNVERERLYKFNLTKSSS
jgi:hypothetical protein